MSILKRIANIMKSEKTPPSEIPFNPYEDTKVGDIVAVDLEEYVVSGKVIYFDRGFAPHRYAYYLQNGSTVHCLIVEKGRVYDTCLCSFLEGTLDNPNDVPTRLVLDEDAVYDLEHHRTDLTRTEGNTDFRNSDEAVIWRYFGGEGKTFYLQWQDGKFVAMQGERVPLAGIKFMRSSR